jgi:ribonuclease P protein component
MLAKKHRLTRDAFNRYFKSGQRHHSPAATLITAPSDTFHGAVVVGKKVSRSAVTRNTYRRRVYAQLYKTYRHTKQGVYIVILKPAFKDLTRQAQQQAITELIAEAT